MRTLHYNSGMLHIVGVPLIILASIGVGFMTVSSFFFCHGFDCLGGGGVLCYFFFSLFGSLLPPTHNGQ